MLPHSRHHSSSSLSSTRGGGGLNASRGLVKGVRGSVSGKCGAGVIEKSGWERDGDSDGVAMVGT